MRVRSGIRNGVLGMNEELRMRIGNEDEEWDKELGVRLGMGIRNED